MISVAFVLQRPPRSIPGQLPASAKPLFPVGKCVTASAKCPRKNHGAHQIAVRFDVVNLFDKTYELRDGSGIGVFARYHAPPEPVMSCMSSV
jgi:hypothetical protein